MFIQLKKGEPECHPRRHRRRLAMRIGAAAIAVGALVMGSMALFSDSNTSPVNGFAAGKVTVGLGTTTTTCAVTLLVPDDSSTGFGSGSGDKTPCTYDVKYTGTVGAWLAADIKIETGSPALYNAGSDGLQMKVAVANGPNLMNGTKVIAQNGTNTTVQSGTEVKNILLSSTPAANGDSLEFKVDYLLPRLAPNLLQGGSATITITFHAVQSKNQPIGGCVAGRICDDITWY